MRPAIVIGAAAVLLLASGGALAVPVRKKDMGPFDEIYQRHGTAYGVDWRLLKAHAQVESSENPSAFNPEKAGADDGSYGLMQVYTVVDSHGRVTNKLNVDGWPPKSVTDLFAPDFNVKIAAQIVAWNIHAYGLPRAIAVYNEWDQHNAPAAGPFKNQSYVDKVLKKARALGMEI